MRSTRSRSAVVAAVMLFACADPTPHPAALGAGATEPHHGGIFRMTLDFEPGPIDTSGVSELVALVFDTLVEYEPGTTRLRPGLAEQWEVADGGATYTFHLRPGVRFHDGRRLVARDVKSSFERLLAPESTSWAANLFEGIDGYAAYRARERPELTGVVAKDDLTVEFHLSRPDAAFPGRLTMPVASVVSVDVATARGNPDSGQAPVGTGPFELARWEPGTRITLTRNPDYFRDGRPYLDGIVIDLNVPAQIDEMRFRRGEIDIRWGPGFDADPLWQPYVTRAPRGGMLALGMNRRFAPWNDVHVRRAVAFAIDREAIARASRGDRAPLGCLLPPGISGHDAANAQTYDPDRARRELALADPAGLREEQELWTFPETASMFSLVQADLARVGIRVRLRVVAVAVLLDEVARAPGVPLSIAGWDPDFGDTSDYFDPNFGTGNRAGFSDPEFEALLDRARVETDPEKRAEMYTHAECILSEDAPWAFLTQTVTQTDLQPWVRGYSTPLFLTYDLRDVWLDLPKRPWRDP